jgi:hypothetical protein
MYGEISFLQTEIKQRYRPEEVVRRAFSKLGTGLYNLEDYNDEHFASWCKCGVYCSA